MKLRRLQVFKNIGDEIVFRTTQMNAANEAESRLSQAFQECTQFQFLVSASAITKSLCPPSTSASIFLSPFGGLLMRQAVVGREREPPEDGKVSAKSFKLRRLQVSCNIGRLNCFQNNATLAQRHPLSGRRIHGGCEVNDKQHFRCGGS